MTCIIGLVDKGRVYIGADSASVHVDKLIIRPTKVPKVFRRRQFIIGYTSSFRMGQILEHCLHVNSQTADQTDQAYMVTTFIDEVRELFKRKGFMEIDKNQESGGTFLVGYRGHLFTVDSDFQVGEVADKYDAVGCGHQFALGAMAVLKRSKPEQRIKKALQTAAYFSAGICPPFSILSLEEEAQ